MSEAQTPTDSWDVIVIGGGPPGENAAQYAVQGNDLTAVIVEKELVGGECSYWACMPSKALLRPLQVLDSARHLPGLEAAAASDPDVAKVLARRDEFTSHHDDSSQVKWASSVGVDVVRGHARLTGERTVAVEQSDGTTRTLHARHAVVISTGTTASVPPIDGLADALPWTSRDVTNLHELPRRVAVIGGGVVACESATWLRGLGAEQVTILQRDERLLTNNEPFAGQLVADRFRADGVAVRVGVTTESVRRDDVRDTGYGHVHGGPVVITLSGDEGGAELEVDEVVVAAGRTPVSHDIGLETVGLPPERYIDTDEHMAVTGVDGDWLYAIGDVCGKALLTHMGKYQGRVVGTVIAARAAERPLDGSDYVDSADDGQVPQVTFTQPEVASVGLSSEQARDAHGDAVRTVEFDLASVAGASLQQDDYVGRAALVVDTRTETVLGATFVGPDVSDLLHSATVAVVGRVPLSVLWHAVPSYPTVSEVWLRLLETYRQG